MANTITEVRNQEQGSKGCLLGMATKKFESSGALSYWLSAPTTNKLYEVLDVDWTRNAVKVGLKPMDWDGGSMC